MRLGQVLVGMLLLGSVSSIPEMATSITASMIGNANLAANTLLGGIAATMVTLAITDFVSGREPISADVTHPTVLLEGTLVILFLVVVAAGITIGDVKFLGAGIWTCLLFILYLLFVLMVKWYGKHEPWVAKGNAAAAQRTSGSKSKNENRPFWRTIALTLLASFSVIAGGVLLTLSSETLSKQTGLGASLIGMVLGGIATTLPEVSTTLAAVRMHQYEMAFSDIFGTNLLSVMLLFVSDLVYPGEPLLNQVGRFSLFATLLGIALTSVYLAGFVERRKKAIARMGIDSIAALVLYFGGLFILFRIR